MFSVYANMSASIYLSIYLSIYFSIYLPIYYTYKIHHARSTSSMSFFAMIAWLANSLTDHAWRQDMPGYKEQKDISES